LNFECLNLLETPWALAEPDLRIRFVNRSALRWWSLGVAPTHLTELVPELTSERACKRLASGRAFTVERQLVIGPGGSTPVELRIRPVDVDGERLLVLDGADLSRVAAKQAMLEEFSRTIEINNRQLDRQKRQLHASNVQMRRVLDNVRQGLLVVDSRGIMGDERSTIMDDWFGKPRADEPVWTYFERFDPEFGGWFRLCFEGLFEGVLPDHVALDQMPHRVCSGGRLLELTYQLIDEEGRDGRSLLIVITDITAQVEKERAEAGQRETLAVMERVLRDPQGFRTFLQEAELLMEGVASEGLDRPALLRSLHTLKGNCATYGAVSVATFCHGLEQHLSVEGTLSSAARSALRETWAGFRDHIGSAGLMRDGGGVIELLQEEYHHFLDALAADTHKQVLLEIAARWHHEPVRLPLERIAEQAATLARRLGKGQIALQIEHNGLRLHRERWGELWQAMIHVIRNAVDHGIETPAERLRAGKCVPATLSLSARASPSHVTLTISDDGRGVDWERVAQRAAALGLLATSQSDLIAALFRGGLSTRAEVTDISGRGVGLSTINAACERLGGTVELESEQGHGTTFRFIIPCDSPTRGGARSETVSPDMRPNA
jgi:two-component system, chemotaxis family, sensor kinase CheA